MNVNFEDLQRQFAAIRTEADALVRGLTPQQFMWSPEPGRWSVAECLAHLNATNALYVPAIREEISRAPRARGDAGPCKLGWFERWFVGLMEPPPRRRFKAPSPFRPTATHDRDATLEAFAHFQDDYIELSREAAGVDLRRSRVPSPASRLISLGVPCALALMAAHERRHLWQAQQVRSAPGFP